MRTKLWSSSYILVYSSLSSPVLTLFFLPFLSYAPFPLISFLTHTPHPIPTIPISNTPVPGLHPDSQSSPFHPPQALHASSTPHTRPAPHDPPIIHASTIFRSTFPG
ncbi:hypothetical protein E2C01_033269 [Portunus trituberculatus]|uniref:Uncharacterized protein n=1 Tax=Portunus trituberculatus TaxID=210409 RepID=A0A5B7EZP7_PORTR|nr:hypothetical protein [Portunus trituberculatus]